MNYTENDLLYHVFSTTGKRKRKSNYAYHVCPVCAINYLFKRPKERRCVVCNGILPLVQMVDCHEVQRIKMWAEDNIIEEGEY